MKVSFLHRLVDFVLPRTCVCCGRALTVTEDVLCATCMLHLPYTNHWLSPDDNEMAREFWGKLPVGHYGALFYYRFASQSAEIVKSLKYHGRREVGVYMGRIAAQKFQPAGFFSDVDVMVPLPLTKSRQRQRGYNQSEAIAEGVSMVCGTRIDTRLVRRTGFEQSQTKLTYIDRQANVEGSFSVAEGADVAGKHILLVDDVVTTGATTVACGKALVAAGAAKISVLSLCFAKS